MRDEKYIYKILVWKLKGKSLLGRHSYRRIDNIKMDLEDIRWVWVVFIWLRTGPGGSLL
jgi:hypothetical protein